VKPIKVAFLGLYFEAWDALDPIFKAMTKDPRFEPVAISMPRRLTGQISYGDEDKVHEFFKQQRIDHIRLNSFSGEVPFQEDLATLKDLAPDYLFTNYPWQRNYPPPLRFDNLVRFTRLAYVPYFSLAMVEEPESLIDGSFSNQGVAKHLYTQRLHQLASLIFTQDKQVWKAHSELERGNSHVFFTGSPKIDALSKIAKDKTRPWPIPGIGFRIIWAPHHSYSPHWLNFGVFSEIKDQMLNLAQESPDIQIVLRPHPFLWGTLVDREVVSKTDLDSWLTAWNNLPNTAIDETGSYAQLFLETDVLITDGISFLGEYPLVTGKPPIFFKKQGHWKFTPIGEIAEACSIKVRSFEQLVSVLTRARQGEVPNRTIEIQALADSSSPYPGKSVAKILEHVFQDFTTETGPSALVDPAMIVDTPWELQPGREAFED
jgi:hypothetical protein